ncbi:MAG: LacI family DNA-binding transcriptional regulator [Chakrabartia sp.]
MSRSGHRRVTAYDIAYKLGIAQSTVSRALNGNKNVSPAMRQRVLLAAQELNYSVNQAAARLRTKSTRTLALVVLHRPDEGPTEINPFYFSLLGCVGASAAARGYDLLVSFQDVAGPMFGYYEDSRQADGLIVIGSSQNEDAWRYFKGIADDGYSVVFFGSPYATETAIRADNRTGGALAARHLIDQGRRKIGYIGPTPPAQQQFEARFNGFAEALAAEGLTPIVAHMPAQGSKEEQGAAAIDDLLDRHPDIDGIFAVTDLFAIGALQKLQARSVDVPGKLSVIGFDGIRAGLHAYPTLTTIEQDLGRAGEMLVDHVLAAIDGRTPSSAAVPVNLQIRGSSRG